MDCAACGFVNPSGHRFCGSCGLSLEPTGREPLRERRLVSVLFVDLVGFTSFSETRDAEDVRSMLESYFALARSVIADRGGVVDKFMGDGVMAVWGASTVREDDAVQAVLAGLDIVDGVEHLDGALRARAGVNTGEAAVDMSGRDAGMVIGDLVNTAARLEGAAVPGTVLVGPGTYRAASAQLLFEATGERVVKGKSKPVLTWTAGGRRADGDSLLLPGFCGRTSELQELADCAREVVSSRRSRLVTVVGAAGIGKTRFVEVFLDGLDGQATVLRGRSPVTARRTPVWPLTEMIRRLIGVAESEDDITVRARLAATLIEVVEDPRERSLVLAAVTQLLVAGSDRVSPAELFSRWRLLFERLAARELLVLVFDDLQRADDATLAFIEHILDWSTDVPILVISLARPDMEAMNPTSRVGHSRELALILHPLADAEVGQLLGSMVHDLPAPARAMILQRCEGVPLYIVEIVRALIAMGLVARSGDTLQATGEIVDIKLPETLTALVAARLDTLAPTDRALVLDASVLGDRFTLQTIAVVSGLEPNVALERLHRLIRLGVLTLVDDEESPEWGQYGFIQSLVREVAYHTLARRDRATRHSRVARFIEQIDNTALSGVVAYHDLAAYQAMDTSPEAAPLALQAVASALAAIARSLSLAAFNDVVDLATQVIDLAPTTVDQAAFGEARARALIELGRYDDAVGDLETALVIEPDQDAPATLALRAVLAEALIRTGRIARARELLETTISTLDRDGHPSMAGRLELLLARALDFQGASADGYSLATDVAHAAELSGNRALLADALVTKGTCCGRLQRVDEGVDAITAGIELADEAGDVGVRLRGLVNRVWLLLDHDPRRAFDVVTDALHDSRVLGAASNERLLVSFRIELAFALGEWRLADEELERTDLDRYEGIDASTLLCAAIELDAARGRDTTTWLHRLSQLQADVESDEVAATHKAQAVFAIAMAERRFGDAATSAWSMAEFSGEWWPTAWLHAARAAIWAGAPTTAVRALERYGSPPLSTALAAKHAATTAAVAAAVAVALDQPSADHLKHLMTTRDTLLGLGLQWEAALIALDAAMVFHGEPLVQTALGHSRAFLQHLDARPYLDLLEERGSAKQA